MAGALGIMLEMTSCDFVGDSGCCVPDCWQCHSPLGPLNLRCLAENLVTAALLCWAYPVGTQGVT